MVTGSTLTDESLSVCCSLSLQSCTKLLQSEHFLRCCFTLKVFNCFLLSSSRKKHNVSDRNHSSKCIFNTFDNTSPQCGFYMTALWTDTAVPLYFCCISACCCHGNQVCRQIKPKLKSSKFVDLAGTKTDLPNW